MSLESAFVEFVIVCEPLTALVGSRIYEEILPQKASYPAITYQIVSEIRDAYSMDGANGQVESRLQVNCYASSGVERRQLADLMRNAIDGFKGQWNGTEIQSVFVDDAGSNFDASPGNEQSRVWGWRFDFLVTHVELVPRFT